MFTNLTKILVAGALVLGASSVPTIASAQSGTRTFTVVNDSRYRIDHVYVSPNNYSYWGGDQLGRDVLPEHYQFYMSVYPGWYDVKLVDEDGDSCIIKDVDFRSGATWTITDGLLVACELFTTN
jgi:hypothetical protein